MPKPMKLAFCAKCSEMEVLMQPKFDKPPQHTHSKDKSVHIAAVIDVDIVEAQLKGETPAIYLTRIMKENGAK
jgi:hypothetical protein